MIQVVYDGTYEGWLTAVFDIYQFKFNDVTFGTEDRPSTSLFTGTHTVITDQQKASRVLNGLKAKLTTEGLLRLYRTFLSEVDQSEEIMLQFVLHVFDSKVNIEGDFGNSNVWNLRKAARIVKRESYRMKAFVRFKLTKDELYYALIEPDCNVLPLIKSHFRSRYADQRWLIYDAKRKYGIYYDLETVSTVQLHFHDTKGTAADLTEICDEQEDFFQELWRRYFSSTNIEARKNVKLHLQHMPRRYWKNLIEKNGQ
ncbi:TIGR03915 family putative DNA repair protein [Flavobacterium agrisoli]|uniref:TIGR03915 family putative DNA repair protein n=1 Tax=Flavobacterium agrisoli TaxID=2793066 RepID=A0A934PMY6_9FLAO|nr:TIGR03915 family putative DNA repair protein [Flavobacterium agrisoli]MBK0370239.1 TIGR03915 family putative DNA repair protein [Flavobacterium agrisoli]